MKVIYEGTADFQEFSKSDFEKAGVEHSKTSFPQGQPVEVPDEVGAALVSKEGLFGEHAFSEAKVDEELPLDDGENSEPQTKKNTNSKK